MSKKFSRQGHWSGQPFPSPEDLPNPGIEPRTLALHADSLLSEPPGKPKNKIGSVQNLIITVCHRLKRLQLVEVMNRVIKRRKQRITGETRKQEYQIFMLTACSLTFDYLQPHGQLAHQAPLSMTFSGQNTRLGCHFLLQGIFPTHGSTKPTSHESSALVGGFFTTKSPGKSIRSSTSCKKRKECENWKAWGLK